MIIVPWLGVLKKDRVGYKGSEMSRGTSNATQHTLAHELDCTPESTNVDPLTFTSFTRGPTPDAENT